MDTRQWWGWINPAVKVDELDLLYYNAESKITFQAARRHLCLFDSCYKMIGSTLSQLTNHLKIIKLPWQ